MYTRTKHKQCGQKETGQHSEALKFTEVTKACGVNTLPLVPLSHVMPNIFNCHLRQKKKKVAIEWLAHLFFGLSEL
jgi:hypothetical protein